MTKPGFVYVTFIAAAPEKVWHALTDAKATAQFLSGFHVAADLREGGALTFQRGDAVLNRGTILECDPPRRLQVTWKPMEGPLAGEKPSRVTFAIESLGAGQVKLTITHDDFEEGSLAASQVGEGWTRVAASLKSFVETGRGMDLMSVIKEEYR